MVMKDLITRFKGLPVHEVLKILAACVYVIGDDLKETQDVLEDTFKEEAYESQAALDRILGDLKDITDTLSELAQLEGERVK